jgi:hypothetical protein
VSVAVVFMLYYTIDDAFVLYNLSLMFLSRTFVWPDGHWRILHCSFRSLYFISTISKNKCTQLCRSIHKSIIIKIGRVSQTQLVNILLLKSFIYVAYLRSFHLHFSAFFSRPSSGWLCILFEATIQNAILSLWYLTRSRFHR